MPHNRPLHGSTRVLSMLLLCACGAALAAEGSPVRGGILTFALTSEPPNFDCAAATTGSVIETVRPHYSGLLNFDPDNYPKLKPDLAQSWEVSPDKLRITFRLRKGVRFHDGTPLTAEDVKVTFDRMRNPPAGVVSIRKSNYEDIAQIDTPDPLTVVFRLSKPSAAMLSSIASPWTCILPAAKVKQDPRWPEKNVMGTGAFKFVRYTPGTEWVGERFDGYFQSGKPYLNGFRAIVVRDAAVTNALLAQQIDAFLATSSPGQVRALQQGLGAKIVVQESPMLAKFDMFFNAKKAPFDDARVRRAFSLAIDRWNGTKALSQVSTLGYVGGALRPGAPFAATAQELEKLPGFGRDVEAARAEARRLLAEAGVANLKVVITTRNFEVITPVVIFVVDQLRRIGVTAEPVRLPTAQQKAAYLAGNFDVALDFDSYEVDEPDEQLARYVSSSRSPRNLSHSNDARIDELFERQKRSTSDAERLGYIRELERRAFEQAWIVPVAWFQRLVPHTSALKGWKIVPSHFINRDLTDVWLEREK